MDPVIGIICRATVSLVSLPLRIRRFKVLQREREREREREKLCVLTPDKAVPRMNELDIIKRYLVTISGGRTIVHLITI